MKLQFYETMYDKSKEYLSYLSEQILPQFTDSELKFFLEDIIETKTTGKKKAKSEDFDKIGDDIGKLADLSKLKPEELKSLFQVFISREISDRNSVKWRFYQYLKYMSDLRLKSVKINRDQNPDRLIDFIIETEEKNILFVLCYDMLELNDYDKALKEMNEFSKKQNLLPDRIVFATNKSFRNIPLDTSIKVGNTEVKPELWVEWVEENCPFNREDLLLVNNSDLKLAGFNFTSIDDLLKYVFKYSKGGQISIYKQIDFYTEVSDDQPEAELIWKGIMLK